MTSEELRKFLDDNLYHMQGLMHCIESHKQYKKIYLDRMQPSQAKFDALEMVNRQADLDRAQLERRQQLVAEWAQYITNETYRDIFTDRYVNGDTWETISDRYHYGKSSVFTIRRKCIDEIARNAVCELVPDARKTTTKTAVL